MSFLTGRVTWLRLRVQGPRNLDPFGEPYLDLLRTNAAGRQRTASADGIESGWAAGGHCLDSDFRLEKNVVGDALAFDLCVTTDKLPADKLKAYYETELKALSANNPSGLPSARQKREARVSARERLEEEAKDGRYKKQKLVPILWDGKAGEVLFGATGLSHFDRMTSLFEQTFGVKLEAVTAGPLAALINETIPDTKCVIGIEGGCAPSFCPDMAWIADELNCDFLGNEFLLWLWFLSDGESDTVKVGDGSEVTFMPARTLTLECPRGQTGHETISSEGPTRLPEARRAIQSGKLPRKMGLTLVRHDAQYEFTLHAETLAVGSAKLPATDADTPYARLLERVEQVRHLRESLDLLFGVFVAQRVNAAKWADVLGRMQRWIGREERAAA